MKIVLISGGSSGIGLAAAKAFAAASHKVYEVSRSGQDAPGIKHLQGDVTCPADMKRAVRLILEEEGRLDILICNAGFGIAGPIEETSPSALKRQFSVNVFGTVYLVQAALPALRAAGGGRILCVSSVAAVMPIPFQAFYSCTKASLNQFVMALNNEVKPFGIRATAVMPGDLKTAFTDHREMAGEKATADEMAKRTADDTASDTVYGRVAALSLAKMEADERGGGSAETLAAYLVKLALKKRPPRPLLTFGFSYRVAVFLGKVLPAALVNRILYALYANF